MLCQDVVNFARLLLSTPATNPGRWTDANMILLADRAVKHVVGQIYFPASRLTWLSIPQQQLFQLPEIHCIERVYVNGQPATQTTIDTMEGNITGRGGFGNHGTPSPGSDAPDGAGGVTSPNWMNQTPVAYPFLNAWGHPQSPYGAVCGNFSPSQYYLRGGSIGITPMPVAGASLVVDCVRVPTTLVNLSDQVVVPDIFMDALGWRICAYAGLSDSDPRSMQQAQACEASYDKELRKLRVWARQYMYQDGVVPATYRNMYRIGGNRA